MYSIFDRSVLIALGMFMSFILGAIYITHDLESDVIDYLEQHGCPTEQASGIDAGHPQGNRP